ncbi:MAG: zf-HC2 domain-containing protein [Pyrinomonadaceae bacterium]|nr:zf-HC2 domain-containing protein [Pyrinomonadaceae bacterium]
MKCIEIENLIDLLLDGEASQLQKQDLKAHLAICPECQTEFEARRQTQGLLQIQPKILPTSDFDNQMLKVFENKLKTKPSANTNWFVNLFAFPKLKFAATAALFMAGIALAFLFGRLSVSSSPQIVVSQGEIMSQPTEKVTATPTQKDEVGTTKPEIKTVIKYVNVPVVQEKIVEKSIFREIQKKEVPQTNKEILANSANEKSQEEIAKQFNLRDLQPVANVTYTIIRKGENNEK